jgi:hypothetical protein
MTSRKFPRVPVNIPCTLQFNGVAEHCRMVQLGQGGALVNLSTEHALGDKFLLIFALPNMRTITAPAEPRHRRARGAYRPDPSIPTVGCSFIDLPEWATKSLAAFVVTQQQTLRQLQFSLALMPPSPKARELMDKVGVRHDLPATQLREFVRWGTALS